MQRLRPWSISVAFILFLVTVAQSQDQPKYKELPNFHQVNSVLYRGGQPNKGGIKKLAQLGVRTIVNLRNADSQTRAEQTEATTAGLRYFNLPLDNFDRPKDESVDRILQVLNAPENQPVFVHCKRGADRTGLIVAIYRIVHDNWNSERAKAEAKRYGLGFWQVKMKDYIHDYYQRRNGELDKATTSSKGSTSRNFR